MAPQGSPHRARIAAASVLLVGLVIAAVWLAASIVLGTDMAFNLSAPFIAAYALLPGRAGVRQALRAESLNYGIDPDWLDAIAWVESRWNLNAVGDNGTSFGPTQLHLPTLKRIGFAGDPMDLTRDAKLAAEWSRKLMVANAPESLEDAASLWNAGKKYANLPAGHVTIGYVAKVQNALAHLPTIDDTEGGLA